MSEKYRFGNVESDLFYCSATPIYQSANFWYDNLDGFRRALKSEPGYYLYSRGRNPTVVEAECSISALERAEDTCLFGSGAAAIANTLIAFLSAGDHVVCVEDCYYWTRRLLEDVLPRFGVQVTFVDGSSIEDWRDGCRDNTKLFYLESPTSFSFKLQDLNSVSRFAKSRDILTVADNTWCSPVFQRPLECGIDLVVHSCSKYLGGHSDLLAGSVSGRGELIERIRTRESLALGGICSPHDAWLILRGIKTLKIRMQELNFSVRKVVAELEGLCVGDIYHPFSKDYSQGELAKVQMSGCGSLFTMKFYRASVQDMEDVIGKINLFRLTVSWGGTDSLMFPLLATPDCEVGSIAVIRFYIGLEDTDTLIADLTSAVGFLRQNS